MNVFATETQLPCGSARPLPPNSYSEIHSIASFETRLSPQLFGISHQFLCSLSCQKTTHGWFGLHPLISLIGLIGHGVQHTIRLSPCFIFFPRGESLVSRLQHNIICVTPRSDIKSTAQTLEINFECFKALASYVQLVTLLNFFTHVHKVGVKGQIDTYKM